MPERHTSPQKRHLHSVPAGADLLDTAEPADSEPKHRWPELADRVRRQADEWHKGRVRRSLRVVQPLIDVEDVPLPEGDMPSADEIASSQNRHPSSAGTPHGSERPPTIDHVPGMEPQPPKDPLPPAS